MRLNDIPRDREAERYFAKAFPDSYMAQKLGLEKHAWRAGGSAAISAGLLSIGDQWSAMASIPFTLHSFYETIRVIGYFDKIQKLKKETGSERYQPRHIIQRGKELQRMLQ